MNQFRPLAFTLQAYFMFLFLLLYVTGGMRAKLADFGGASSTLGSDWECHNSGDLS
jgi:hypothetical protein